MAQLSTTLRDAPPRGTCRSFLMAGTLRVRTAEKTTLKPWGSLSVRRPKLPASAFGLAQSLRRWGALSIPTPELPASASGIGMGRLTCYAWHAPCVTACHPATRTTLIAHSRPPRLCTYAVVMPSSPMLRGGSNHYDGSNGIELYINDAWLLIDVFNDDMTVVGDGMPLRLHE